MEAMLVDEDKKKEFNKRLIEWFRKEGRRFSWREKRLKPYEVLIVEMMLQRTRAEMVTKAYANFLEKYPHLQSLKSATLDEIARVLKPIGLYNRRAKWMKTIAELLVKKHGGKVPREREALYNLPGLGMYNANAILCFAYNKPVALIDINVARVLGRIAGIQVNRDLRRSKKLHEFAAQLVPAKEFKEFNWALIDLGATVCTSKNPKHDKCPISNTCKYFQEKNKSHFKLQK